MITLEKIQVKLREAILQSGITQTELAIQLGVSQPTISHYVKGDKFPALDMFANLCKILDVDTNDILCITDSL